MTCDPAFAATLRRLNEIIERNGLTVKPGDLSYLMTAFNLAKETVEEQSHKYDILKEKLAELQNRCDKYEGELEDLRERFDQNMSEELHW